MAYSYNWFWESVTEREIDDLMLSGAGLTIGDIVQEVYKEAYEQTYRGLAETAVEEGLNLTDISVTPWVHYSERLVWTLTGWRTYYTVIADVSANFSSDRPLMGSPVAAEFVLVVKWIISAVVTMVVAYFAVQAVKDFLISLVTKKNVIRRYKDGVLVEEEEVTTPSIGGTAIAAGIAGALIILALSVAIPRMERGT